MTSIETGTSAPRTVQSVTRAVTVLKEIARTAEPNSLSDLARSVGLSKPAVYNLLKTLEIEGLVRKGPDARYSLGWGMYELGTAVLRGVDLTRVARLHLDRLAVQAGEASLLAILDDSTVLYLDRGQSDDTFTMVANVGRRSPLHSNASGKVLLAGQEPAVAQRLLDQPLTRSTRHTITDRTVLAEELERVRAQGYAVCSQEQELGLSSIAVPIRDHTGSVLAALTVAGPSARMEPLEEHHLLDLLRSEAREISTQLGAPPEGVARARGMVGP